jgi:hypothetical protein
MSEVQGLSINEAAKRTGKSAKTIQRRLDTLEANGATKDESGAWKITEESLVAAGFDLVDPDVTEAMSEPVTDRVPTDVHAETLAELEAERRARAVAEEQRDAAAQRLLDRDKELTRTLADRDRELAAKDVTIKAKDESIDALRIAIQSLRALESGQQTSAIEATSTPTQPTEAQPDPPKRRWWSRR